MNDQDPAKLVAERIFRAGEPALLDRVRSSSPSAWIAGFAGTGCRWPLGMLDARRPARSPARAQPPRPRYPPGSRTTTTPVASLRSRWDGRRRQRARIRRYPRLGAVGTRFGRNTPIVAEADLATSRPDAGGGQRGAAAPPRAAVPAGQEPEPACGSLAAVRGPRLVRAPGAGGRRAAPLRPLAVDARPEPPGRPAGVPERSDALVGRSQLYGANETFAEARPRDDSDEPGR